MSHQNPIFWDGEQHDPSPTGHGVPGADRAERIGCGFMAVEGLTGTVLAFTGPLSALATLGITAGAIVLTLVGIEVASKTERKVVSVERYGDRSGWSSRSPGSAESSAVRLMMSRDYPVFNDPDKPIPTIGFCASVDRPSGRGTVAVTGSVAHPASGEPAAQSRPRMCVWVELNEPLPALQVFMISDRGAFTSESIEFNDRLAIAPWPLPGVPAWDRDELRKYASDFFGPQVMRSLVDSFNGLPDVVVREAILGVVVEPTEPYRAELALDVLLDIRRHIPSFLSSRYADRTDLECRPSRRSRRE